MSLHLKTNRDLSALKQGERFSVSGVYFEMFSHRKNGLVNAFELTGKDGRARDRKSLTVVEYEVRDTSEEHQLNLFSNSDPKFEVMLNNAQGVVQNEYQRAYLDAWYVGVHCAADDIDHNKLYQCGNPLVRMGYRHGLSDSKLIGVSGSGVANIELDQFKVRALKEAELAGIMKG